MYKLLLATDRAQVAAFFRDGVDWHRMGYHHPYIVSSSQEAVIALESKAVDAVGYLLEKSDGKNLNRYLRFGRPSLPVFEVTEDGNKQVKILQELLRVMDRLHADFYDEYYDPETVMTQLKDEFIHDLLSGKISDFSYVQRLLIYLRARFDPEKPLMLFDIDMPQGEIYMSERHDPALRQERLEAALRNNFFGRYQDDIFYGVAVVSPRHIRLVAIPAEGAGNISTLSDKVRQHVEDSFEMVKNYLELDMNISRICILESIRELMAPVDSKEE